MARRKLSRQGRIVAAGLSIGVAGALAGFMAADDHTAASQPASAPSGSTGSFDTPSSNFPSGDSSSGYEPYDDGGDSRGTTSQAPQYSPQPQTRTGGS